jgi:hypothetical protein
MIHHTVFKSNRVFYRYPFVSVISHKTLFFKKVFHHTPHQLEKREKANNASSGKNS